MRLDEISKIGNMERPGPEYSPAVLQTYKQVKSGKKSNIHARPYPGQGHFSVDLDAECCRKMREDYPIGRLFLVWGKVTDRLGGGEYVYTYHG